MALPEHMHGGIERYIDNGISPGGFLEAVFANDLMGAFYRADSTNVEYIREYAQFIYSHAPSNCHGDYETVYNWKGTVQMQEEN